MSGSDSIEGMTEQAGTTLEAENEALRKALTDCLHTIGNSWMRYGVPVQRWPALIEFERESDGDPTAVIHEPDERSWVLAHRSWRHGAELLDPERKAKP